jgi:AraC family transcriptional regulator
MRATTVEDYKERMLRVMLHVQEHLDGPLDPVRLAGVAAFSPFHFHRVFKGMVGESVQEYVRRLRLERSAIALKTTDRPVIDLALEAGYASHEAFTRAFRSVFDRAPSEYREAHAKLRHTAPRAERQHRTAPPPQFEPCSPDDPEFRATIETLEPLRVAFCRHVGPYDECGGAWDRLMTWAGSEGLIGAGACFIGLCHDDPEITAPEKVRYDACITIDRDVKPAGEFGVQTIEGGPHARATHFGPYNEIERTYVRLLGHWAPRSGRAIRAMPCLEMYLNSPENTEPEDLVTDVYLPLEP